MEINPFILTVSSLFIFLFGGVVGVEMSKAKHTLNKDSCTVPYVITEDAKVFVLNNDKTIIIFKGQPYYFNESSHKIPKAKLNERTPK